MEKRLIISGLCLLCLLFARCSDPFAKEQFVAYDQQPVGLYLETMPEYSDWVKLLKKADLFNAVNINLKYTCFVANNQAVQTYIHAKNPNWKTVDDLTEDEASSLMKYHVIPGADYAFISMMGKIANRTSSGDYLTATINEDGSRRFINGIEIVKKDKQLINGYVHELQEVLDPIIYTVMEILEQRPEYSMMVKLFQETGLDAYLSRKEILQDKVKLRDYKSVMVATDSVFNAAGLYTIEDVKSKFAGEPTDVRSDFYKFVGYHIFPKSMDFGDLTDFAIGSDGQNIETYVPREFITIKRDGDFIYINPTAEVPLQFVPDKYDLPANNGYIHEVSGIMEIAEPVRYPMVWEPTDIPEFRALDIFRMAKVKGTDPSEKVYFKQGEIASIRWKTIPFKENVVAYLSEDVDWDRFMNDDGVYANLGSVGWIEFDTPTLMRGKYNIKMEKWLWFQSWGSYQMYIDENKFVQVNGGGGGANQGAGSVDLGIYRFEESGTHVFRFSALSGPPEGCHFYVDRFTFTPVD